jgi:2-dehydropantoate 2-reductase
VAAVEGVQIVPEELIASTQRLFAREHRTSMQKDVDAGRRPEVDGIGGAIVRRAERYGIAVPMTRELIAMVLARASHSASGSAP